LPALSNFEQYGTRHSGRLAWPDRSIGPLPEQEPQPPDLRNLRPPRGSTPLTAGASQWSDGGLRTPRDRPPARQQQQAQRRQADNCAVPLTGFLVDWANSARRHD